MAENKQVEYLHQQASALYLQGEYDAALVAWRQLLNLDPHDERAREGARLCELLVKESRGSIPGGLKAPRARAAPGSPAGVGFGAGEQLDQEFDEIDELLGGPPRSDWMDSRPTTTPRPAAPAGDETLEFDLSAVPTTGPAPDFHFDVEAPDRPPREPDSAGDAFDLGPSEPGADDRPAADLSGEAHAAAADELQHRTNELMAEALEFYERGEREEALSALTRLTILDENNEAALNFAAHIRGEIEGQNAPQVSEDAADAFEEPGSGYSASRGASSNHEPLDRAEPPPAGASKIDPPVDEDLVETSGEAWEEDAGIADELSVAAAPRRAQPSAVATATRRPNKALILAAGGLVVLGALYVVFANLDRSRPEPVNLPEPPPIDETADPSSSTPATGPVAAVGAPPVDAAAAPLPGEARARADALMDRADREFEAGDYATAVLSYNEALKLDPQNEVARKKLQDAGELFREQKTKLEERAAAFKSFEDRDYRNALRLFYRIEPGDAADAQRLMRYKAIGWYNLGASALMAGDCRLARSHLIESQQIDPLDPRLARAIEMNAACFEGTSQAYFEAARTLPLRTLED